MLEQFFRKARVVARLRLNPFGPWFDEFVERLQDRGHPLPVIHSYTRAVEHCGVWVQQRRSRPETLDREQVAYFLDHHLPHCQCRPHYPVSRITVRAALWQFLRLPFFARNDARTLVTPAERLVAEYLDFLRRDAGLAAATIGYRGRNAREFLAARFGNRLIDWASLRPAQIARFLDDRARDLRPQSTGVLASSLRSFLRFLHLTGRIGPQFAEAVASPAQWRHASVPRVHSDDQVRAFLKRFDRSMPIGRRDYAMSLCLVELGLRVSELAALRLDDIDWRAATVRIRDEKTDQTRFLPLSRSLGRAIAAYLRRGRGPSTSRALFVRTTPPLGEPVPATLIRGAVRRVLTALPGCERFTGTHVLRHTAASRMLRRGVPLKLIADFLRHRSLDTTAIDAKTDGETLRTVALPWPEEEGS